jgi:hypothetical protein
VLITESRSRTDIVVGVPHHAPAGQTTLPCKEHPVADENCGFLGKRISELLDCCSVIACNYTVDVNKYFRTDYSMQIATWNPKVLVEIHGHGGKTAHFDIEISSGGPQNNGFSKSLADALASRFASNNELKCLTVSGDYDKIYFKATKAVTISDGRWISYHIELPPRLRMVLRATLGKPPEIGCQFCGMLADVLKGLHGE